MIAKIGDSVVVEGLPGTKEFFAERGRKYKVLDACGDKIAVTDDTGTPHNLSEQYCKICNPKKSKKKTKKIFISLTFEGEINPNKLLMEKDGEVKFYSSIPESEIEDWGPYSLADLVEQIEESKNNVKLITYGE